MSTTHLIQTNHGVSYPLVGPNRVEQEELFDDADPPERRSEPDDRDTVKLPPPDEPASY